MIAVLRWILGLGGPVFGLGLALLALALGHCSSFGGRCPADGPSDDVFGTAGTGIALAVALPIIARGWSRRAIVVGTIGGVATGALGGFVLATIAAG